jgi:predicted DNA-binding WGR domain protein
MSAIVLTRRDPARNMQRYYKLDIQPDLFGAQILSREWGRIGRAGQCISVPFDTHEEAAAALDRQRRRKERNGYV